MSTPQLRLIKDPRAQFWGRSVSLGLPHTLLLNWLDHPNDGEPGDLMPEILWESFAELGLTNILFTATPDDAHMSGLRRITRDLLLAEDRAAFLRSIASDQIDSWQSDQCFFALPHGDLPKRSDPALDAWQPFWALTLQEREQSRPTRLPDHVPLLLKVHEGEDAAWAVAFAESIELRDQFADALGRAAEAREVTVTQPEERSLFADDVWARHGPVA